MKLLIVHNAYGKPSGEEAVVDTMSSAFAEQGVEVRQLRMTTEGLRDTALGKARGFLAGLHSPSGVRAMRQALQDFRPDIVNVHNLYPFISPAALRECRKAGVPVLMTVHNFRLICPTGLFMRDGAPCEECLTAGNEWPCLRHNCEASRLKTLGYAARNYIARTARHYKDCVTRFVCITDFQRRKLIQAGYDADRITVIPNAVATGTPTINSINSIDSLNSLDTIDSPPSSSPYVAFCGRLSREKGVDLIIEVARRHPEIPFRLAGAVRDQSIIANLPANVTLAGFVSGDDLRRFYREARFIVMASRCYEGFPVAILEAAREHRPTVAPDHGGFTEIITDGPEPIGQLFTPADPDSLEAAITRLWTDPTLAATLGEAAHRKLLTRYSLPVVTSQWLALMRQLLP